MIKRPKDVVKAMRELDKKFGVYCGYNGNLQVIDVRGYVREALKKMRGRDSEEALH